LPDPEEIAGQRQLLANHRSTLAVYINQQALLGVAYAPPGVMNSIRLVRSDIQRIKAILRGWNVPVDDLPGEDETN